MRLLRFAGLRLLLAVPVVFGVVTVTFVLVRVLPGDPVQAFVSAGSTAKDVEEIRARLGLDTSIWQQYLTYLGGLLRGDLGTSVATGVPISTELSTRIGPTFELVFLGVGVALVISVVLGVWSAMRAHRPLDHVTRVGSLVGTALPEFWLALVLIVIGYQWLGWFPGPGGRVDRGLAPTPLTGAEAVDAALTGNLPAFTSAVAHLVLPVLTIVVGVSAALIRTIRATALEIRAAQPWACAQAHGLTGSTLVRGYLMRGTLARLPTLAALVLGNVLGGVVLVELVFSWQGMGQWLLRGLLTRDYPVVQAGVVISALVFTLAYLAADIVQAALDPRVRV